MVLRPYGRSRYLSGNSWSQLSAIDTAADRVVLTLEVGKTPQGMAIAPDGRRLLGAVYGEDWMAVFDTASVPPRDIFSTAPAPTTTSDRFTQT